MRRKTLIVIASVGALLIAALLFVRAWVVRDDTAPVSLDKVVQDYRGETSAASTTPPPATSGRIPDQGVYTYATTGGEQTILLGTSKHDYPEQTSIAIRATDCGFRQTWTALDKRVEEWTFCKRPDALEPQTFRDVHSFYGRDDDRTYECGGGAFPLKTGEAAQTFTCKTDSTTRTDHVRAVGREQLQVDGTTVDTIHLRDRITLTGSTTTKTPGTADWWLRPETGLPVRIRVAIQDASDTPIGKKAQYEESFELTLQSLTPQG